MRASIENMLNQIREFFARMEKKDKIRLGILTGIVATLAIIIVIVLGRTNYVTLHIASDEAEAGMILSTLREMGEDATTDGTRILVPEGRVSNLRAILASMGTLGSGQLDTTLLDSASGFNITDSHAREIYARQKAQEIRTQILMSDKIQNAFVTVNMGEYSPFVFSDGVRDATAAVMLTIKGGATLTQAEAQGIADLVRSNIPGLKYENITITDQRWTRYPVGDSSVDIGTEMYTRISLRNLLQQQLQIQCEQLLAPIFGMDNLRISASVTLNFDKQVSESVEFSPPIPGEMDGIVRSSSEIYENQRNAGAAGGIPGTDTNGMGTVEYPYASLEDGDEYRRAVREYNYEINETRSIIEHEQGTIEKLSIAISINDLAVEDNYATQVRNLVASGLGIAPDNIAVEQIEFKYQGMTIEDIMREQEEEEARLRRRETLEMILKYSLIAILILSILLLARMILKTLRPEPEFVDPLLEGAGGVDYLADDEDPYFVDMELNTKSSALEQIERFIDKDPSAVAQLLRNWLTDE
ncbi:MAG: flagellar M-ring protein FliF [Oscillospiraceae bacterium]|nr:flagellar M-ring protein FliF [Oscillospiraceae bacterium]